MHAHGDNGRCATLPIVSLRAASTHVIRLAEIGVLSTLGKRSCHEEGLRQSCRNCV